MDPRFEALAKVLTGYSTKVGPGDVVLFKTGVSTPFDMNRAICQAVRAAGGAMLDLVVVDPRLYAEGLIGCTESSLNAEADSFLAKLAGATVYIDIRGFDNQLENTDVPGDDLQRFDRIHTKRTLEPRLKKRWVLTRWPTPTFSYMAGLSTSAFEEFFFNAVLADYPAMAEAVKPLEALMAGTDQVRIIGPETELLFSIKGIGVVPCVGLRNIPDGECETAPVIDSMNGQIQYNTLTVTRTGDRFEGVGFRITNGVIVDAWCKTGNPQRLQELLDTDEGARRFGEFSLGINWGVQNVIGETLFDEKVGGTFHLTPGNAYEDCDNGNRSGIHWDIVCDQRAAAGGGEIWFDGVLIRKDGLFVPSELTSLNPAA